MSTPCGDVCTLTADDGYTDTVMTCCKVFSSLSLGYGVSVTYLLGSKAKRLWKAAEIQQEVKTWLPGSFQNLPFLCAQVHQQAPPKDKTLPQLARGNWYSWGICPDRGSGRITERTAAKPV